MSDKEKRVYPVRENMWLEKEDGTVVLLGSRCPECGEEFFPQKEVRYCPHCHCNHLDDVEFESEGTIIAHTSVIFRPAGGFYKGPVPFNYISVRLNKNDVIVQGHYIDVDEEDIHVGDQVKAISSVLWDNNEETVTAYKFVPLKKEGK